MNINVKTPKPRQRTVDSLEYNGRFYTADDLDKIFRDLEATEDALFTLKNYLFRKEGVFQDA